MQKRDAVQVYQKMSTKEIVAFNAEVSRDLQGRHRQRAICTT
jgi:hypothetical protein